MNLRFLSTWFCLVVVFILAGCSGEPVGKNLSQKEANQIVALLANHGIASDIESASGGRAKYEVSVNAADFTAAISVVHQSRLLAGSEFKDLISERGILPSSRDFEALRVDHARALEIAEHLESHPAIASANVAIRHNFPQDNPQPGVSALVETRAGAQFSPDEVRQIILNLVPGVKPENVQVSAYSVESGDSTLLTTGVQNKKGKVVRLPVVPFMLGARVVEDDYRRLALGLLGFLVLVSILGGVVGYWYGNYRGTATIAKPTLLEPSSSRLERLEGPTENNPEV